MAQRVKAPKILTIEGIIASGKTTLLSKLQTNFTNLKLKIIPEPIASWENTTNFHPIPPHFLQSNKLFTEQPGPTINGDSSRKEEFQLLSQMYKDSNRWCFSFQLWALYTRIKTIERAMDECIHLEQDIDVLLIERSSSANRIFAHLMYDHNYLNECEWLMYNHFFDYFNSKCDFVLDGIIYLDCPVDLAMRRIEIRNRKGESSVTEQYQTALQHKHNEWLLAETENERIPILQVGVPYDCNEMAEKQAFQTIRQFMDAIEPANNVQQRPQNIAQVAKL